MPNCQLIDKPNLKQAMTYWRNQTRSIRLIRKISLHSLGYTFVQELIEFYKTQGYSEKEREHR